jgi:TolB-like protein
MSSPSKAVFVSYASQDVEAARRICDALRAVGLDVWLDQSELRGGDAWDVSIRRQIKECALFVAVISANTQAREEGYFRLEWKLAVDRTHFIVDDKAFLVPVVIDATTDDKARVPEKFREVQWTRLPAGETSAAFAEQVQRLLSGGAVPQRIVAAAAPATVPPGTGPPSIAVLPFVNHSHDEADEYFSDGLADELLNVLAKIPGLRVAARSSAFTFKGKGATVAEVGRALKVATVLEGSVRKAGNRMRISVQLVKVADGYHLWSEIYDRTLDDIFAVQDDIAQSVLRQLRTTLLGEVADARVGREAVAQVAAAAKGRTTNPEAHRLFLQGRYFIDRNTHEDAKRGIGLLQEALALDPTFALAWAALGGAYAIGAVRWVPSSEGFGHAREAVARALALEPDLAEGHEEMGWIQIVHDLDPRGAEVSLRRALGLAPGNARVLRRSGVLAATLGRLDEAIALDRRALEQDPLSNAAYHNLGLHLDASGCHADAEAAYRKALDLAPQQLATRSGLALSLFAQGRGEEALGEALREPLSFFRLFVLAIIHQDEGRRAESDAALQELIANHAADAAYQVAEVYAARGDVDCAFEWLERAYDQRDGGLSEMKHQSCLRSLHADPRWDAFLRKMGLAD